jgi:8-oxo-dGTP diphosphatase
LKQEKLRIGFYSVRLALMSETIKSVGIVAIKNGQVLLVRHEEAAAHFTGALGQPAGRIEPGETAKEAALREFQEETGLVANPNEFVELPTNYEATIEGKTGPRHFYHRVFLAKQFTGNLIADEKTTPLWVDIEDLKNLTLLPNVEGSTLEALKILEA